MASDEPFVLRLRRAFTKFAAADGGAISVGSPQRSGHCSA